MINLYGELSAIETVCHLIVINELEECIITIPSPFDSDSVIDLYVNLQKNTKNKVEIINGSPYISCDMKKQIEDYLYKTSKDYKSDIAKFGKYAVSHFLTWKDWLNYNWCDNYENSFFDVNVNVDIISSYLIS